MAKKMMKKTLALVLAMTMCITQFALPAMAVGSGESQDPQITVTVSTTTTDTDSSGKTTTKEYMEGVDQNGSDVVKETTTTEQTTVGANGIDVTVDTTWDSQQTVTDAHGNTEVTEADGKDTAGQGVAGTFVGEGGIEYQIMSQHGNGEESSLTTSDNKEVDKTDVEWQQPTPTPGPLVTVTGDKTTSADKDKDDENTLWNEGESKPTGTWNEGQVHKGETLTDAGKTEGPTTTVNPEFFLTDKAEDDVTMVMTPKEPVDSGKVELTYNEIMNGQRPDILDWNTIPADTKVEVKPVTDSSGQNILGWEIIKTSESSSTERTQVGEMKSETDKTEIVDEKSVAKDEYEQKIQDGAVDSVDADGNPVKTWVERITDDKGNSGYREVKETTIVGKPVSSSEAVDPNSELAKQYTDQTTTTNYYLVLPTNLPAEYSGVDVGKGGISTLTVTPITDQVGSLYSKVGDTVGYKIEIITRDEDGKVVRTEVQEKYATACMDTRIINTDPTTLETITVNTRTLREIDDVFATEYTRKQTQTLTKTESFETTILTETDLYQVIDTDQGMYFMCKGEMFPVVDRSQVSEQDWIDASGGKGNIYAPSGTNGWYHYAGDQRNDDQGNYVNPDGSYYNNYKTYRYRIVDTKGNYRWVYCVETDQSAATPGAYFEKNMTDNDPSLKPDGTPNTTNSYWGKHIRELRSVCLNAYWGNSSGIGSLDAVKDLLRRHGYTDEANSLTSDQAIAATQTAIWKYGAPDGMSFDNNENASYSSTADNHNIHVLRQLLITLAEQDKNNTGTGNTYKGAADAINKDSITGATITLHQKVLDAQNKAKTDENGNELFDTTISFGMSISQSSLNGDMVVKVLDQDDKLIKAYRLSDDGGSLFDKLNITGAVRPDGNGNYYLEDLQLAEGVRVTLKLEGLQHLDDGVIIYRNTNTQDFIGLATKDNHVDLEFDVKFTVSDPAMKHTNELRKHTRTDTVTSTADGEQKDTLVVTVTTQYNEESNQESYTSVLHGVVTDTKLFNKVTLENARWDYYYEYLITVVDDEDGNDNDDVEEIFEEEVPLAAAPKTGDPSLIFAAISALSMAGAAVVGRKKEE